MIYAATTYGWSAFRRYYGSLASKSVVNTASCSLLSFKISWRIAIKALISMLMDLLKVMSAILSTRKNNSPRVLWSSLCRCSIASSIYLVNTIATWAVICAGLEKQELNKNLYGQNFCSQFCFLTAGAAEKAVVNDENIFSFLICQITNVIIYDIRGKKRSKMEPVCFCGIKEAIIRVLGKIFPKRAC